MESSLSVPPRLRASDTGKLLDENRRIINKYRPNTIAASFLYAPDCLGHLARIDVPSMNMLDVGDGKPVRIRRQSVNLGVAIDLEKKDGTRSLLVPNIKNANKLRFSEFLQAYDSVVKRAREGKLQLADFQGTTISLTNPGTIGTVASTPRLMAGQSVIIATGAIEYPAEYQAMAPEALSQLGISKAITISSTYDHRSFRRRVGAFLARLPELLTGNTSFMTEFFQRRNPLSSASLESRRNPFLIPVITHSEHRSKKKV